MSKGQAGVWDSRHSGLTEGAGFCSQLLGWGPGADAGSSAWSGAWPEAQGGPGGWCGLFQGQHTSRGGGSGAERARHWDSGCPSAKVREAGQLVPPGRPDSGGCLDTHHLAVPVWALEFRSQRLGRTSGGSSSAGFHVNAAPPAKCRLCGDPGTFQSCHVGQQCLLSCTNLSQWRVTMAISCPPWGPPDLHMHTSLGSWPAKIGARSACTVGLCEQWDCEASRPCLVGRIGHAGTTYRAMEGFCSQLLSVLEGWGPWWSRLGQCRQDSQAWPEDRVLSQSQGAGLG